MHFTQPVATADSANQSIKTLLSLPNELLWQILAIIPFDDKSIRDLRLACQRLNDLTHTKEFYVEVAQKQFSNISTLFIVDPSESNLKHIRFLQHELVKTVTNIIDGMCSRGGDVTEGLKTVVEKGVALLMWLCHHATEHSPDFVIANPLLGLARRGKLSFAAILTIKMTMICIFEYIIETQKLSRFFPRGFESYLYITLDKDDMGKLFWAFESTMLWVSPFKSRRRGDLDMAASDNRYHIENILKSFYDPPEFLARKARHKVIKGSSTTDTWSTFLSLLDDKFSSHPNLEEILGSDLATLTDTEAYFRIKFAMMEEELAKEVLKSLDLDAIGRGARLSSPSAGSPVLWDWSK